MSIGTTIERVWRRLGPIPEGHTLHMYEEGGLLPWQRVLVIRISCPHQERLRRFSTNELIAGGGIIETITPWAERELAGMALNADDEGCGCHEYTLEKLP